MVAPVMLLAACSSDGKDDKVGPAAAENKPGAQPGKGKAAPAQLALTPAAGAKDVETDGLTVAATGGKVTQVTVTDAKGGKIEGAVSPDGAKWLPAAPLLNGATYKVAAKAANADGEEVAAETSFSTVKAEKTFTADFTPFEQGDTVGVGTVVSVKFNKPVKDKASIQKNLKVTAEPAVEGSWSWVEDNDGSQRADFRPKEYWKPGTKVTLEARLNGAKAGPGLYGKQDKKIDFTIGRSSVAVADLKTKQMTLTVDGQLQHTLPISAGGPNYATWTGTMIVLDKVDGIRMNSETVGLGNAYDMENVRYAVHLSNSGTYAHAAPWNEGKFGKMNDSHGCIGMSTSNAGIYFKQAMAGDPMEVVNGTEKKLKVGNGFGAWNLTWDEWVKGSALNADGTPKAV
jgi:lipoprotein-anchoring transpeptidase ErfK/SrfK